MFLSFYAEQSSETSAGSAEKPWFTESGFVTGIGSGAITEGQYRPVLLIWHLAKDLKPYFSSLENHRGTLSAIFEPQVNPVFSPRTDFEAGIGLGFNYRYPVTEKLSPYAMASVGPHYISVQTENQANGFIFADTVGAGFYYFLTQKSAIDFGYRLRHMSNAGMKTPNGGINAQFGTVGYSVFF